MKQLAFLPLLLLSCLPAPAFGEAADDYALVGAGIYSRPQYDGSNSQTVDLIPVLRYYGKPWFARTTQGILEGGARAELTRGLAIGAQLAYEAGRRASGGISGLDPGASLGVHLEWDTKLGPAPLNLLFRTRKHFDADRGTQADLRFTAGVYGSTRTQAGVFTQATWANRKSMESFYGVHDSGLLFTSLGVLGSHDLSRQWALVGSVEGRRLASTPARTPIVERRLNYYASAGLAYRF
jgi:outer membrane scaffolding protein for murein synthesis (MipA/OmpV family)